jgi:hypothetical protein
MCDLPLRDGKDAMRVNWLAIEITGPDGQVTYRNSFITDLAVDRHTVVELIACGRARWKIENETFNTLKTKGYNLEHNFGHGEANLAAFAFHTVADLAEPLWRKARAVTHTRIGFFNVMRALTVYIVFASWAQLLKIITFDTRLPRPP